MNLADLSPAQMAEALRLASPALRERAQAIALERIARRRATLEATGGLDVDRDLLDWVLWENPGYHPGRVHRDLTYRLMRFSEAVALGQSPRLMFVLPPRHGKTETVGRRWPGWHLKRFPGHEVVYATYGQTLSNKVSRSARATLGRARAIWPGEVEKGETWGVEFWEIARRAGAPRPASFNATSVGGGLTGDGAHVLILDDLIKDAQAAASPVVRDSTWDWVQSTALTRLAPGGGVVMMGTRWDEDDPMGRALADPETGHLWEVVRYPAIAEVEGADWRAVGEALHPERYTAEDLAATRALVGERFWASLYQGRPTPKGGGVYREDWTRNRYEELPSPRGLDWLITVDATFDGKAGSDFVALQVWARDPQGRRYAVDRRHARMDYVATRSALVALAALYPMAPVLIEKAANGAALISDLRGSIPAGIIAWKPTASKLMRAQIAAREWEAGLVWLPAGAHWVESFVQELIRFTGRAGGKDDQVDAMSSAFLYWSRGELPEATFGHLGSYEGAGFDDGGYLEALPFAG